jgi:uncharacterized protein YndB with AHSA1/START domain
VLRGSDGSEMGMRGVYREIARPERLVFTESFDDFQSEALATLAFVEDAGRTTFTNTLLYPSQQIRDEVLRSGMEHGAAEGFERLAEVLAQGG